MRQLFLIRIEFWHIDEISFGVSYLDKWLYLEFFKYQIAIGVK